MRRAVYILQCLKRRLPLIKTIKEGLWLYKEMGQPYSFAVMTEYTKNRNRDSFVLNRDYMKRVYRINKDAGVRVLSDREELRRRCPELIGDEGVKFEILLRLYTVYNGKEAVTALWNEGWLNHGSSKQGTAWYRNGYHLVFNETGAVDKAVYVDKYGFAKKAEKRFSDTRIPYIKEAGEIVKKAAQAFPEVPYIGWDIAVTKNGPVLLKGDAYSKTVANLQVISFLYHGKGLKEEINKMLDYAEQAPKDYCGDSESLAQHAEECLGLPTVYMWGGLGQIVTEELIQKKASVYPEFYTEEYCTHLRGCIGKGIYGFDCSGLIKNYLMGGLKDFQLCKEVGYNSLLLLRYSEESGPADTLPEIAGTCLYMPGHVGIYMGNGRVIEATMNKKFGDGVVETKLNDREWTEWFFCPAVKYKRNDGGTR